MNCIENYRFNEDYVDGIDYTNVEMGGTATVADESECQAKCAHNNCRWYLSKDTECNWLVKNDDVVMYMARTADETFLCKKNMHFIPPAGEHEYVWATIGVIFGLLACVSLFFFRKKKQQTAAEVEDKDKA